MSSTRETYGLACPKCGSDRLIVVRALTWLMLCGDATPQADHCQDEWDDDSQCACGKCGYNDQVARYTARERGVI